MPTVSFLFSPLSQKLLSSISQTVLVVRETSFSWPEQNKGRVLLPGSKLLSRDTIGSGSAGPGCSDGIKSLFLPLRSSAFPNCVNSGAPSLAIGKASCPRRM